MKYRRHDLHGLLVIDKPQGLSSMDVVRRVRRAAGHCKTGHAGTLDPMATGVLVCCLGKGTKAVEQLMGLTKVYETTVDLSAFSTTDDAEGELEPVPPPVVAVPPDEAAVRTVLASLTGVIEQAPPAYSAIKIGGRRAYDLARRGEAVEIKTRPVRIDAIDIQRYDFPLLDIVVTCGKGTYIRSLARQIGGGLGTGGHLTRLRRLAVGPYTLEQAYSLDDLPEPLGAEHLLPLPDMADRK